MEAQQSGAGHGRCPGDSRAWDRGPFGSSGRCHPGWRAGDPTPVCWPAESRGQRSLVGYSPWGYTGSGTAEQLCPPRPRRQPAGPGGGRAVVRGLLALRPFGSCQQQRRDWVQWPVTPGPSAGEAPGGCPGGEVSGHALAAKSLHAGRWTGGPQLLCGAQQLTQRARSKVAGRLLRHTCQHRNRASVRFLGAHPEGLTGKRLPF